MIKGVLLNALPVINIISPTNPNPTPKSNNIKGTAFDLSQDPSSAPEKPSGKNQANDQTK